MIRVLMTGRVCDDFWNLIPTKDKTKISETKGLLHKEIHMKYPI